MSNLIFLKFYGILYIENKKGAKIKMNVYIIIALEKFGTDWDIYKTVFFNEQEAKEKCQELNNRITGYKYFVKERNLK